MACESWFSAFFCHIKYSFRWGQWENLNSLIIDAIRRLVSKLVPYDHGGKHTLQLPLYCLTPLFDIHQVDAPMLKSLAVTNVYVGSPSLGRAMHRVNKPHPPNSWSARLRNVQIDIPQQFLPTLQLPWAQLEELP